MYIKTEKALADADLDHLERFLVIIDKELSSIFCKAGKSADPESEGFFDRAEYFVGVALTAIQQYISCTYAQFKISKSTAFALPPMVTQELTFVSAINAGANFWKHSEEWGIRAAVHRDINLLKEQAQRTIKTIETLTPWDDYTLSNLVVCLAPSNSLNLAGLTPYLIRWREAIDSLNAEIS